MPCSCLRDHNWLKDGGKKSRSLQLALPCKCNCVALTTVGEAALPDWVVLVALETSQVTHMRKCLSRLLVGTHDPKLRLYETVPCCFLSKDGHTWHRTAGLQDILSNLEVVGAAFRCGQGGEGAHGSRVRLSLTRPK